MIRQGDILIVPVDGDPLKGHRRNAAKKRTQVKGPEDLGHVVAEGEATGHHHVVRTEGVKMYELDGVLYLDVPEGGAELEHDEHSTLTIPKGVHRVQGQREHVAPPRAQPARVVTRRVWD